MIAPIHLVSSPTSKAALRIGRGRFAMSFSSSLSGPHLIISIICGQGLQVAGRIPKIKAHKAKLLPGWRLRRIAQISSTNDMQGLSGTSPAFPVLTPFDSGSNMTERTLLELSVLETL